MKRKSKYRKHVEAAVLDDLPEPKEDEAVVIVVSSRGGNMLEVREVRKTAERENLKSEQDDSESLCILPAKFRKLVWVRRGTLLIVSKASDDYVTARNTKGKVKFTVNNILFADQVKNLISKNIISQQAIDQALGVTSASEKEDEIAEVSAGLNDVNVGSDDIEENQDSEAEEEDSGDSMDDIFVNTNRVGYDSSDEE